MTKFKLVFLFFFSGYLLSLAQETQTVSKSKDTLQITPKKERKLNWEEKDSIRKVKQSKRDSILKSERKKKKQLRILKREERQAKNIRPYNALAPSKAAFYSAIVPGLGQVYNKQYWKVPIVYGALGTSVGIAIWNDGRLKFARDIYRNRLRGIFTDEFFDQENNRFLISNEGLVDAQQTFRKQKELSILISIGIYVLNIVDANVTAHLQQYNLTEDLTLVPKVEFDPNSLIPSANYGLALKYSF